MTYAEGYRDSLDWLVDEYEAWLRSWASDRTTESRVTLARRKLSDWGLEGFTPQNVQAFLAGPRPPKKPWKRWTKATYHAHLTDLCKWLVATEYLEINPMDDVRSVKRPKGRPRPIEEDDMTRVLSVVTGETRDWIALAMYAGLRVSEIARIRGEDVTTSGIRVTGKGDVTETLPLHDDLLEMVQRYPRTGFWFPGSDEGHVPSPHISLTVGRLFHGLGIEGSIHRCRHYFATALLRNGVHIRRVQQLMRHANLETTALYTAVDEDELSTAVNLLPSRLTPSPPQL